jgi:hypothetical protein
MFTRFNYDKARTIKNLEESTGPGKYVMNVPGNGISPYYISDPQMRLEKWGANLKSNSMSIDNQLRGLNRKLNKDCVKENYHLKNEPYSLLPLYPTVETVVQESRTETPAWEIRELPNKRMDFVHHDPQQHIALQFQNNISTRILEKDHFNLNACKQNDFS